MYSKIILLALASVLAAVPASATDYYVSPSGDDANSGTLEAPFRTLAKAGAVVQAGDTCLIRAGVYEEVLQPSNSGTEGSPVVFKAYPGEHVVISAMQALSGWTLDSGSVYKTTVDWDLGQKNFVMHNSTACELARWPNNEDGDIWTMDSLRSTGGSGQDVAVDAYLDYSSGIPNFGWSKGGSIWFYGDKPGAGWIAWKAFIKSNTSTRLTFDLQKNPDWIRTWHSPADGGEFYLEGIREALDFENEWYFDSETLTLYLQIPGGGMPADGAVSMRRRVETINLTGRSHVEVHDVTVFGGEILINGDSNRLYRVTSYYGNYTRGVVSGFRADSRSVMIQGNGNTVEKCDIGYGAGSGIWDQGSNTTIINNYVHDFNTLGSYDAVLMVRDGGGGAKVLYNTFERGGRDGIQMVTDNNEVAYNDVSRSNLIADDCGLFYTVGGPHNTVIHHNWFHDVYSHGAKYKGTGIYLDNNSWGYEVHHNVIWNTEWTGVQINKDAGDISIYNNTFWNNERGVMGAWHAPGTSFTNVKVWNNISNDFNWEFQADRQNNLTITDAPPFVDWQNGDFRLLPGTQPIDAGRVIEGITDGYVGSMPDAGAYEYGGEFWIPGIDWDPAMGPVGFTDSQLVNLSVRTTLAEAQNLIVGFVTTDGSRQILVRAVGPGLEGILPGYHPDPQLQLFRGGDLFDENDNWPATLKDTMDTLGAFSIPTGSADAALEYPVAGAYSAHVHGPGAGIILLEAYDAGGDEAAQLVNVSARNDVGTGADILIAGFVIQGNTPRTVLVRGVGPTLGSEPFNLPNVLQDPKLEIFDGGSNKVAENDRWSATLTPLFDQIGAFQLTPGSEDAALRVTLDPGSYTVQVSGADGGTGEAIIEVYALP